MKEKKYEKCAFYPICPEKWKLCLYQKKESKLNCLYYQCFIKIIRGEINYGEIKTDS